MSCPGAGRVVRPLGRWLAISCLPKAGVDAGREQGRPHTVFDRATPRCPPVVARLQVLFNAAPVTAQTGTLTAQGKIQGFGGGADGGPQQGPSRYGGIGGSSSSSAMGGGGGGGGGGGSYHGPGQPGARRHWGVARGKRAERHAWSGAHGVASGPPSAGGGHGHRPHCTAPAAGLHQVQAAWGSMPPSPSNARAHSPRGAWSCLTHACPPPPGTCRHVQHHQWAGGGAAGPVHCRGGHRHRRLHAEGRHRQRHQPAEREHGRLGGGGGGGGGGREAGGRGRCLVGGRGQACGARRAREGGDVGSLAAGGGVPAGQSVSGSRAQQTPPTPCPRPAGLALGEPLQPHRQRQQRALWRLRRL